MAEVYNVTIQDISYHLLQINDSGELQLSTAIRKIPILSDKWDEQGVLLYNLIPEGLVSDVNDGWEKKEDVWWLRCAC